MAYILCMDTKPTSQPKKKRGPARRMQNMVDTHLYFPADLLEWAKRQPEGFAPLMRQLAAAERQRRERRHASP